MRSTSLLGILLDFLETLADGGSQPADVRLSKFFRARKYLGSRDRRFISDGVFSYLRHRERGEARWRLWRDRSGLGPPEDGRIAPLGPILVIAGDGLFPWGADEVVEAAGTIAGAAGGRWTEVLERVRLGRFLENGDWPVDAIERLAAETSLPVWLARRLVEERGLDGARALGLALLEPAPVDIRVNLSLIEREVVRKDLESALRADVDLTPYSPAGLRIRNRVNLRRFMSGHPGWIEIQDEGSQLAALATDAAPGETIVDACAGGGGKTLAMADRANLAARFHVCDIDASKLTELLRRAEPLGLRSLTPHQIAIEGRLPPTLPKKADLVVADVPCSGLGSLRRNPDLKHRYREEDIERFGEIQAAILDRFSRHVRPGGRLVYITCSVLAAENEEVVLAFRTRHPDFDPVVPPISRLLPPDAVLPAGLRLDPVVTGTDGFFVAVLTRRADSPVPL